MRTVTCIFTLLAAALALPRLTAQSDWIWRLPTPTANRVASYVYAQNQFVGVGQAGVVLTSPDGTHWTNRESGVYDSLIRVVFDGTRYVAVGGPTIISSTDGITWSKGTVPAFLTDVACGNGVFVAIAAAEKPGEHNRFLTSTNGTTWTLRDSSNPQRVGFANGVFVAPNDAGEMLVSADGVTWTAVLVAKPSYPTQYFAVGTDRFLAVIDGDTYLSTNGTAWRKVTSETTAMGVKVPVPSLGWQSTLGFAGGYFYIQQARHAYDGYKQYRSADGETWTSIPELSNFDFSTLAYGGGKFVASEVTRLYSGANTNAYEIHVSSDGLTWQTQSTPPIPAWNSTPKPVYGLGRFYFAGQSSHDGITWTPSPFAPTHAAGDLLFRVFSVSPEGETYPDVATGGDTRVAVSVDGLTSAAIDTKVSTPRDVAFDGHRYVVVGDDGAISTSLDGVTWSSAASGTTNSLRAVRFLLGRFIAVGDRGTMLTSPDGVIWTRSGPAGWSGLDLTSIAASADRIVIGAGPSDASPESLTLAPNIAVRVEATHGFRSIEYYNSVFLAAGRAVSNNVDAVPQLWQSADGITWSRVSLHAPDADFGAPKLAVGNGTAMLSIPMGSSSSNAGAYGLLQAPGVASASPTITYEPANATVHRGESAYFSLGLTGTGPFTYQWYKGSAQINGETRSVLTLDSVLDSTAGDYSVVATSPFGVVTSHQAHLTVEAPVPLTITKQPIGGTVREDQIFYLRVEVAGSGPVTYQWRHNGTPIYGATRPTYSVWGGNFQVFERGGTYDVVVSAPYSTVTSQSVSLTWSGPTVTVSPSGLVFFQAGTTAVLTATATGTPPFKFTWRKPGGNTLQGATGPTLTLPLISSGDSSPYSVEVEDATGQHATAGVNVGVQGDDLPVNQRRSAFATGSEVTLRAPLSVSTPWFNLAFQWKLNGSAIPDATASSYTIAALSPATEGVYSVVITQIDGGASRTEVVGEIVLDRSRLVNLSARAYAGKDEDSLIQGFVLSGPTTTSNPTLLVRSIGPGLVGMGVSGVMSDPLLRVLSSSNQVVAENDNWSTLRPIGKTMPATLATMQTRGAFSLGTDSRDSALEIQDPQPGIYSAVTTTASSDGGVVLTEIYAAPQSAQTLVNLSARALVSGGDRVLVAGFVIDGKMPMKVLLRAIGPTLANYGVAHPVANPLLTLFDATGHATGNNDTWSLAANVSELRAAVSKVGAFSLGDGSNDAAMLVTLNPGVYSMQISSVGGSSGIALAEIYDVP